MSPLLWFISWTKKSLIKVIKIKLIDAINEPNFPTDSKINRIFQSNQLNFQSIQKSIGDKSRWVQGLEFYGKIGTRDQDSVWLVYNEWFCVLYRYTPSYVANL